MDIPSKNLKHNNQSLYLNKVLQKNLGIEATDSNFPNFKENITNFHSNLQNILSNEERRQKAMKYVIDMRNRKIQVSPALDKNNHTRNVDLNDDYNNNNAFSKTINDGFYDAKKRNKNGMENLYQEYTNTNYKNNIYKNKYYGRDLQKDYSGNKYNNANKPYRGYNIYTHYMQPVSPDKLIKVNKNLFEQKYNAGNDNNRNIGRDPNIGRSESKNNNYNDIKNNYINNNIYKKLRTYRDPVNYPQMNKQYYYSRNKSDNLYNKNFNNYNDFDNYDDRDENEDYNNYNNEYEDDLNEENNDLEDNLLNDYNNSGMRKMIIDNDNDNENILYKSPKYEIYNDEYDNENNEKIIIKNNKYSNSKVYNKYRNKNNNLNNVVAKNNKIGKNNNLIKSISEFNNLKIEKNKFTIRARASNIYRHSKIDNYNELMKKAKENFAKNAKVISTNKLNIKGKEDNKKLMNKQLEEINNLKNEINLLKENNNKKKNELINKESKEKNKLNEEINKL